MSFARSLAFVLVVAAPRLALAQAEPASSPPFVHAAFPGSETPLGTQVDALLLDPKVSRAHWGIAVTSMDGTPLYGRDEGKFFRPASNQKLLTTAAAMALLGPDATTTTDLRGKLDSATGTVSGDLTLVGRGDANFGTANLPYLRASQRPKNAPAPVALGDLANLADQLQSLGVKHITGRIVGNDAAFPSDPYPSGWDYGDLVWGYGAPVSALSIADNQFALTISPGTLPKDSTPGRSPTASLDQYGVPFYTVDSKVYTTAAGTGTHIDVQRNPGERVLHIYGTMAVDAKPDVEHISIDEPALYAAMALKDMLQQRGIAVDGQAATEHSFKRASVNFLPQTMSPTPCDLMIVEGTSLCSSSCMGTLLPGDVLVSHTSAPLVQDVTFTLKVSQNLHAEILLHRMGLKAICPDGSAASGARLARLWLKHAELDPQDFIFYDGSGLSTHDLITPRAIARLLAYTARQPWFAQWKAALPVGGEDGTLAARFPDPPLKDHLFAKTGTLGETRALSGYLDCRSGKQVIFSIIVDDHTPVTSDERAAMDKIVAAIAANN